MADFVELSIALDQVCFLVVKARQLNAKDVVTEPDPGSNPSDDGSAAGLEAHLDDPTRQEILSFFKALNTDELLDLATLAYLGRDDGSVSNWSSLRSETAQATGAHIVDELIETPLLADFLEEGLSKFSVTCTDLEANRL